MPMDRISGFFDELEKIAISTRMSSFMQSRSGRRPIRAETLLAKRHPFKTPPDEKTLVTEADKEGVKDFEVEGGPGMIESPGEGKG